jgi:hypothetical protein
MPANDRCRHRGLHGRSLVCGIAFLASMTTGAHAQSDLHVVRLQLQWFHQAQFVGYYVAMHSACTSAKGSRSSSLKEDRRSRVRLQPTACRRSPLAPPTYR